MTTTTEEGHGGSVDTAREQETGPQPARIPDDTFAHRLMLVRAMAGHLSIRDAADMTGLNRGSWQGWERGLKPRDLLDVVRRVSRTFDVDHDWLLFGGELASEPAEPPADAAASRSLREPLAEEVRSLLERRKMSASALARSLGKSQTYVWRRLNGETAFDTDDLELIARILRVHVSELLPVDMRAPHVVNVRGGGGRLNSAWNHAPGEKRPGDPTGGAMSPTSRLHRRVASRSIGDRAVVLTNAA